MPAEIPLGAEANMKQFRIWILPIVLGWGLAAGEARAEGPINFAAEFPDLRDSGVSWIDSAIPMSQIRTRWDSNFRGTRFNRAEFLSARPGPFGPGLNLPEREVDWQELRSYVEVAYAECLSAFVESPLRFLNPDINPNTSGPGDLEAGFKFICWCDETSVLTAQLKTYIPIGDSGRGLGTDHFSVEPALLAQVRLCPWLTSESELRVWIPIDGTNFAGEVVRYGTGLTLGCRDRQGFWITPVGEMVGWAVLRGKEQTLEGFSYPIHNAAGSVIVNANLGFRWGLGDRLEFYGGYSRALTGNVWYKDACRLEIRLLF